MKKERLNIKALKVTSFITKPETLRAGNRLDDTDPCSPRCALSEWEGCKEA